MTQQPAESFNATSGRFTGVLGLVVVVALFALGLQQYGADFPLAQLFALAFAAVLVWSALLRPRISMTGSTLVLRNMLETVEIPLAAVDRLVVRQMMAVRAGGRRFVNPGVGRPFSEVRRGSNPRTSVTRGALGMFSTGPPGASKNTVNYADFVEERVRDAVATARRDLHIEVGSAEQEELATRIRRRPAWPEIVLLVVTGVGLAVTLLL